MDLNVQDWKEFKLSHLLVSDTGDTDITQDTLTETGVPVVSSGEGNTGVIGVTSVKAKIFPANTITMDMFGFAFPRSYEYKMVTHARVFSLSIKNHLMTTPECIFMATMLNGSGYKYAYGRMCSWERIKDDVIQLPIQHNSNGTPVIDANKTYSDEGYIPDWKFMENYIKSLHHKPLTTKNKSGQAPDLNVQDWGEFCLGKLFNVSKAYAYNQETFEPIEDVTVNKIGCITRTANNNGLDYYGEVTSDLKIETGNALTIGGEGVVCFYQPEQFVCGTNMTVLRHKNLNKYNGLFISRVIDYYSKDRFSYGRAFNKSQVEKSIIKLPVDSNGNPDWQFMENYIKSLPYGDRL